MMIIKKGASHSVLHSVGIGYSSNEYLIRQAAKIAGGACEFVAPGERIEPKVLRLFQKMASSSISDLHVNNVNDADQAPAVAFLLKGEATTLFLKTQDDSLLANNLTITGSTGENEIRWNLPLQSLSGAAIPIPVLWAREKIRDIEESTVAGNGSRQMSRKRNELMKNLVSISKQYGVISKDTSYVAIEKRAAIEGNDHEIILRKVPVMLAKGWGGVIEESTPRYSIKSHSIVCDSMDSSAFLRKEQSALYMSSDQQNMSCYEDFEIPSFLRRSSAVSDSFISSSDRNQEVLMQILSCQQLQGGFILSKELATMLGLPWEDLHKMAHRMIGIADCDKYLLFSTMLTIELLERKYSQYRSSWWAVIEKSISWLHAEMQRCHPTIGDDDLDVWIRRNVLNV
jgi:Ca-activated chloride channel family protein